MEEKEIEEEWKEAKEKDGVRKRRRHEKKEKAECKLKEIRKRTKGEGNEGGGGREGECRKMRKETQGEGRMEIVDRKRGREIDSKTGRKRGCQLTVRRDGRH